MIEIRKFKCGCVDHHDSALWASTCVTPCQEHDTGFDFDPEWCQALYDGVPYVVVEEP